MNQVKPHIKEDLSRSFLDLCRFSGKSFIMTVATGSMAPLIRSGDRVKVTLVGSDHLRPGDIVAFHQGEKIIVHRLLKVEYGKTGATYWQKGDALSGWGWFDGDAFLGRVEALYRGEMVLEMQRLPWRFYNRILGIAGCLKQRVFETARRIKQQTVGDPSISLLTWMVRADSFAGRGLQRLLIKMIFNAQRGIFGNF